MYRIAIKAVVFSSVFLLAISYRPFLFAVIDYNVGNIRNVQSYHSESLEGETQEVLLSYRLASQYSNQITRFHLLRGWAYYHEGDLESALEEWSRFDEIDYWLILWAKNALEKGENLHALELLEIAILLIPDTSVGHYYKGIALYRTENYEEALRAFHTALEIDRYDERFTLGRNLQYTWWPARPISLNEDMSSSTVYIYMASIYYQLQRWADMQIASEKAVDYNSESNAGYFQLGESLYRLALSEPEHSASYYDQAKAALKTGLEDEGNFHYRAMLTLAQIYEQQGDLVQARSIYLSALPRITQPFLLETLVLFFLRSGNPIDALSTIEKLPTSSQASDKNEHFLFLTAYTNYMLGEVNHACALLANIPKIEVYEEYNLPPVDWQKLCSN